MTTVGTHLPGQARDIAAGVNQRVAKVHPDGRVMLWRMRDQRWFVLKGVDAATDICGDTFGGTVDHIARPQHSGQGPDCHIIWY